MAGISTSIELQDHFSSILQNICNVVNITIGSMADMQGTMAADIDTSSLESAREQINMATLAINEMNEAMQNTGAPQMEPPQTPAQPPEPIQWRSDSLPVFTGTGTERFQQEIQSANSMLQQLSATQNEIASQAHNTQIFSPEMAQDMNNMAARIDQVRERIQQIENNPVNMGTDTANAELEQLRAQLNQAVQEQELMNRAVENMDVQAANEAYLRLSQTMGNTERYIRDNVDEQGRFNREIEAGTDSAAGLKNMIASAVGAFAGIAGLRKARDWIEDCTTAFNTQLNAENQLMAVLRNMLDEEYVAQFELETTADTTAAIDEVNAIQNSVDGVVVPVTAETKALNAAYDQITAKASEIQGRGIYGDEAMIAAAAEFSTYFTDANAIEMMMDTLANYAMGMSGGGEIDSAGMVDYATNLGKIMSGAYDAMTKKGFEFTDAQKSIIEGEATREQIVSALGEEYLDMSSDMQAAAAITQIIDESWAGLYESMSNTPEGKIIQMTNAWGDMKEVIGGQLYPYVLLFVDAITENWGTIQSVVDGITIGLKCMLGFFAWLVEGAINFAQVVIDNWSWIGPIIGGVVAILATYALYLGIVKGIELASAAASGAMAIAKGIQATAIWLTTSATWAETTAQLGLNGAMYACPIVWIVGMLIALIAVIIAVANHIAKTSEVANTGFSVITGGINVVIQFFKNLALTVANIALGIGAAIEALANNIRAAFHNALSSVKAWWYDLLSDAMFVIEKICVALNQLPFVEFDYSGITAAASDYAAKAAAAASDKWEYTSVADAFQNASNKYNAFQDGWAQDAYNEGAEWGNGITDKISDMFNKTNSAGEQQNAIGAYTGDDAASQAANTAANTADNTGQTAANTGQTADNTAKIADALDISNQELKYLRDIAERKAVDRYATTNIKVEMINNNNVSSDMDIDGFVNGLTAAVSDAMMKSAEGVHI